MNHDSKFQHELKNYKNEIKDMLPFSNEVTKKLLDDLQNGIDDYIENNDVTSFDEIIEHFGKPDEVAEDLKNITDAQVFKRKIDFKKIIISFAVIVILIIGIGVAKIAHDADKANAIYGDYASLYSENESSDATPENLI